MQTLLTAVGIFLVLWLVSTVIGFLVVRGQLRKRNRVVADTPSPTPLSWLASPAAPARLHRRLRAAIAVATATPSEMGGIADIRADLARRARELDGRLATAGRAKGPRRRDLLREVAAEIDDVDAIAHRIDRLANRNDRTMAEPGAQPELDRLAEQLATYEDAAAELADIEARLQGEMGS